ncbi:MAG: Smr/MutS family protein [Opitutaceae bacterium]|nr:Smr/MutS family protein [Opitutaceae bacterium]
MPADPEGDFPPIEIPITGELDLHTFRPQDLGELLPAYFQACLARGLTEVRIVHGKGTGTLRETVHHHLRHSPYVVRFRIGDTASGSWGATIAFLRRP